MSIATKARTQWDRLLGVASLVLGAVVLTVGWFGVSGTPFPAEQIPYIISAGLGGLFLLGCSAILLLSADLQDEWRKLDRIEQAILAGISASADSGTEEEREPEAQPRQDLLVSRQNDEPRPTRSRTRVARASR